MSITAEIHDTLAAHGITRTDAQIEYAVQFAAESARDVRGWWVDPESIQLDQRAWDEFLNAPDGVFDLLEVDVEDGLYDRLDEGMDAA